MDGSSFLFDLPVSSSIGEVFGLGDGEGILYVEDFDAPPAPRAVESVPAPAPEPLEPVFSKADVVAAHAAGRQEGMEAALADARLLQAQMQAAATQALADALAAGRGALERAANRNCGYARIPIARTMCASRLLACWKGRAA